MQRTWLALFSAAALTLAVGCGDKDEGDSGDTDHSDHEHGTTGEGGGDATAGADVYSTSCAGCHGAEGEGASGPAMSDVVPGHSEDDIASVAMNGEGSMPPILSDATQAADVAAYCVATWGP